MIELNTYSVSAINTLEANYPDPLLRYKQNRVGYEQGFALNKINALANTLDSSINNYTTTYLTDKVLFTDVFSLEEKPIQIKTITTPLIFNIGGNLIPDLNRYLYIYKTSTSSDLTVATCRAILSSFVGYENNINFELEVLNNIFLRVKHNNGTKDFFLNALADDSLMFYSYSSESQALTSERNDMFRYYLDEKGYLQLFKKTRNGLKIVTLEGDEVVLKSLPSYSNYRALENTIRINYNFTNIQPILNNSWISYNNNKINNLTIDTQRSLFDINAQYVLHGNYNETNKSIDLNYLPLNNFRSEKNYIKRGANLEQGIPLAPDVGFREYMSLQTGNSQERGNDNIALTYIWYDKDIKVTSGADTYFTTPSSLYPFERININDTKFIANGSFGGKTPLLSDKVFMLKNSTFNSGNGRYLCTWLSGGGNKAPGIWLDRYFYPDIITKESALSGYPVYAPSFIDTIDTDPNINKNRIATKGFFDRQSELCLLPNTRYYYSRIGESDILNQINSSYPTASGFTDYYNIKNSKVPYSSQEITYDGTRYNRFNLRRDGTSASSFTISFDAYIDPNKSYGYQLLGNLTNKGFGVINDPIITPFIFVFNGKNLKIFNSSGAIITEIDFAQNIIDVITSDALSDFFVSCESGYLYKVNTLGIKQKLEILPELINYSSFYQDDTTIAFYVRGGTPRVYVVNKTTLESVSASPSPFITNFSILGDESILKYNNQYLTLPGQKIKYIDTDNIYYSISDETIIKQNLRSGEYTQFVASSAKEIIDFSITSNNDITILHNKTKVTTFDKNRNVLIDTDYSSVIGLSSRFINVDTLREYADTGVVESHVFTFVDENSNLNLLYGSNLNVVNTGLSASSTNSSYRIRYINRNKSQLTNFNHFKQTGVKSGLDFKLTLTNYLSSEDIITRTIKIDKNSIDKGYHNFTYMVDTVKGVIELYINGNIYGTENIPPGKYAVQDIFNDDIFIGSTGFYNSQDLASYLRQPGYYYARDFKVKNFLLYSRPITQDEIHAISVYGEAINDLILSIPAGQRNNFEEIERYFKFAPVPASSKNINIYVKNSGITNIDIQNNIKNLILSEARSNLPVGTIVNDIQFIDFK